MKVLSSGSLGNRLFEIPAGFVSSERIERLVHFLTDLLKQWFHIGIEGFHQTTLSPDDILTGTRLGQGFAVHNESLGEGGLEIPEGLDHGLEFGLDVV